MAKQAKKVEKVDRPSSATWWGSFDLKLMADMAVKFPIGARVKYIGTKVERHHGKIGEVVWYKNDDGLVLRYEDGNIGTSTRDKVKLVSPPNMEPNQVSALLRFLADYLDKTLKSN